jgi:uncharacterized membrane protein YgdD (TMEM256/DUF423 family)
MNKLWIVGTGATPLAYQLIGLMFLIGQVFVPYLEPIGGLMVLIGFWGLAELARIRDEIRKFND